ncbi:MAG TPA: phosphonate C-P lyase system protein PhnG [Methylomirabilota bacterium]|nr:phosphonate C-P lyase system protein PhnG [Methylomirabilota bacterium]
MTVEIARVRWMSALAQAEPASVAAAWAGLAARPAYRVLRGPETGLVMVRGRAGGTGAPFNLGEMTVTRCSVELSDGTVGHAYVAGRDARHAETAAVLDAMLQDEAAGPRLEAAVIAPLLAAREARQQAARARAAATRVEFFTMVRGDE